MRDLRGEVRRRLETTRIDPTRQIEIVEEIGQDLEDRYEELRAQGVEPAAAEAEVVAELAGHEILARELARVEGTSRPAVVPGAPRGTLLGDLKNDLWYATRALVKSPAFTAVTLLSLALGIGANTAIFELIDAVHLRSLPVADPTRLADVRIKDRSWASGGFYSWHADLTNPMWERIRDGQEGFQSVLAWGDASFNLSPTGEVHRVRGLMVSGGFFATLGVPPMLGRVLTTADDRRGCGAPGAVVSHAFWQRELGGDAGAVGAKLSLDGHEVEILGVTPPGFDGLEIGRSFDVAVPICMDDLMRNDTSRLDVRHAYWLSVVGRLRPGWSIDGASAQLDALSERIFDATVPETYAPTAAEKYRAYRLGAFPAGTGISSLRETYSEPLYFLLATAGLVLLIACASLANLFLARASSREREIAVRLALGASRGRLIRQLMTESLLVALLGAAAGLWLAGALSQLMVRFLATRGSSLFVDLEPDWRVLAFTGGLAALTCVLFGLAPALRASRTDIGLVLKSSGGHGATVARYGARRLLVAAQVALSFVLLVGALLFSRSLVKLASVATGFDERGVLTVRADLRKLQLPVERRAAVQADLLAHVRSAGAIAAAASTTIIPISGSGWNYSVFDDATADAGESGLDASFARISSGYFETMAIPRLAGRDFGHEDTIGSPTVAIVNEALARRIWGAESPVGRRLRVGASSSGPAWSIDVVGLVKDTKYGDLSEANRPLVYLASSQDKEPFPSLDLVIRRSGPLPDAVAALKQTVADVSPRIGLDIEPLERVIHDSLVRERLTATLSGFFGVLAGLLATIGLYAVVAYGVARRKHEIGIRMALGADRWTIARLIVRETAGLVAIGLGAGIVLALAATRAAASMLFGLPPHDPLTFAAAALLLGLVTILAGALPARRAASVDPMAALRDD